MKTKKLSKLISFLCSTIIFTIIVPHEYALLSASGFTHGKDMLIKSLVITAASILLIIVCLFIIRKFSKADNALFDCCLILLLTDPLLKCSMLNLKYICLLIATLLLCFYFSSGKSTVLKTALMAVFAFASVIIYTDAAFCHVPLASLIYSFTIMSDKKETDDSDNNKKPAGLSSLVIIPSVAVPFIMAVVLKTIFADTLFTQNMIFRFASVNTLFYDGRLLFAVIPSVCLLVALMHKYFATKYEGEKTTLSIALKKAKLLMPVLISLIPVLLGIFVFDSYPAATVSNMFFIIAMFAIYRYDPDSASDAFCKILSVLKKHKYIWCALFFIWLVAVSSLFRDTGISILDDISYFSGGKL